MEVFHQKRTDDQDSVASPTSCRWPRVSNLLAKEGNRKSKFSTMLELNSLGPRKDALHYPLFLMREDVRLFLRKGLDRKVENVSTPLTLRAPSPYPGEG
ncbi:MAG: hypothetical protein COT91_04470 [Candidatus Doudnabacteria bacterium CG10_big_fil_rev_8_21_14_0_10_41_10]|uniref:Uncharacterized protein n=1 Tax=Candidatus Doudnabacteria bacterium CG10_big_fil_rev_8_21_14_0_10_41_10 TaxID=1974551 RepID=A0A2H0VEY1_9BACT|nr:MAG: hypothetical protein COT91_04470 [Candidatus Doudnabacteria bacterium CG10_big_fil_rev_8_21_14_0_10_41_10]